MEGPLLREFDRTVKTERAATQVQGLGLLAQPMPNLFGDTAFQGFPHFMGRYDSSFSENAQML